MEFAEDVITICQDLIRIDTTNFGDNKARGEREAAEYCQAKLAEVDVESTIYESEPGRASLIARIPGADRSLPALILHGHLDVVPAIAEDWSVDPFGGVIKDGMLWGRGAVDMKHMDAMILAGVRRMMRSGVQPKRDLIIAFFADEEAGGTYGAQWLVSNHAEVFEGAGEAISEVGGFSTFINGKRVYLLQTAEKGMQWVELNARGTAGHGSQINTDNPVTTLASAISRIGEHEWPYEYTKTTRALLESVAELTGQEFDEQHPEPLLEALGHTANFVTATLKNTSNPTVLDAGYKMNVIPTAAKALVDIRVLPDNEDHVNEILADLAGEQVAIKHLHTGPALEVPFSGDLVEAMIHHLQQHDPEAVVFPYMLSGGTDNKALARLGITGYGFTPLQLPEGFDFTAMFHGVDERIPLDSLVFGAEVLYDLAISY
ncbi:M20/M25/M40 family metallo-hydrolase [Micrococcoides hystricis]|uniref:M20/M25/M40 family metallo-hydrolase n=1 Tax=Micrococcoides hystricis TaxID=1572761 RepID=A0ABV6P790_9MICC